MFYSLCKYLFNKLDYQQILYFINHPIVKSYYLNQEAQRQARELAEAPPLIEPEAIPVEVVVVRFDSQQYERLEQVVSNTGVVSTTSEIEAGFKLGVQHVLQKLRAGYVISKG